VDLTDDNAKLLLALGKAQVDAMFHRQEDYAVDDSEFLPLVEVVLNAFEAVGAQDVAEQVWEYAFDSYDKDCKEAEPRSTTAEKAKPGQEGAVKEALMEMVEPTRKEKGCLAYNLHQSKSDKAQFIFYEQWASQAALDAHMKSPHMKALGDKLKDKTEKVDIVYYELLK